jgi:hypothetical protein
MVVQVLATNATAMCICIVSPAEDARFWDIIWEQVTKPVDAICSCPGLVSVSIQPMNDNNTAESQVMRCSAHGPAYSTRGLSPSATTLRPWGDVSTAAFEGAPTCYCFQPGESKAVEEGGYCVLEMTSDWNKVPPRRWCHSSG